MAKKKSAVLEPNSDIGKGERMYIKLGDLLPNPYQPPTRVEIDEETAKRFGLSILEHGLLQMPVVRVSKEEGKFEVGDGWLRLSGYKWLVKNKHPEYTEMPVVLRGFTDIEMADLVLEANSVRQDMNAVEKAWYYNKYLSDFKKVTQAEFAKRHNISQSEVANTIRLLELPEEVKGKIISREITESHGRALLAVKDKKLITKLAGEIVQYGWSVNTLNNVIKADADKISPTMLPKPEPVEAKKEAPGQIAAEPPAGGEDEGEGGGEETGMGEQVAEAHDKATKAGAQPPKKTEQQKYIKCSDCTMRMLEKDLTNGRCKTCHEKSTRPKLSRPEAIGAPPTESAKAGKRKLVVEETDSGANVSVMAEGKFPVMKTYTGSLHEVVKQLPEFLSFAAEQWAAKKEVK
jgi:ParB family chromosome partitioning protein